MFKFVPPDDPPGNVQERNELFTFICQEMAALRAVMQSTAVSQQAKDMILAEIRRLKGIAVSRRAFVFRQNTNLDDFNAYYDTFESYIKASTDGEAAGLLETLRARCGLDPSSQAPSFQEVPLPQEYQAIIGTYAQLRAPPPAAVSSADETDGMFELDVPLNVLYTRSTNYVPEQPPAPVKEAPKAEARVAEMAALPASTEPALTKTSADTILEVMRTMQEILRLSTAATTPRESVVGQILMQGHASAAERAAGKMKVPQHVWNIAQFWRRFFDVLGYAFEVPYDVQELGNKLLTSNEYYPTVMIAHGYARLISKNVPSIMDIVQDPEGPLYFPFYNLAAALAQQSKVYGPDAKLANISLHERGHTARNQLSRWYQVTRVVVLQNYAAAPPRRGMTFF